MKHLDKGKIFRKKVAQHKGRRKRKRYSMITPRFDRVAGGRYKLFVGGCFVVGRQKRR